MSAEINIYNPEELGPPMGQYTHVTRVKANEFLFIAGMLSGDSAGNVIGEGDFDLQTRRSFATSRRHSNRRERPGPMSFSSRRTSSIRKIVSRRDI
jgi:hypothetical protein